MHIYLGPANMNHLLWQPVDKNAALVEAQRSTDSTRWEQKLIIWVALGLGKLF